MTDKNNFTQQFVHWVIDRIGRDNRARAVLTRADNPGTAYQSWEILSQWCDLSDERKRLPLATVSAALSRARCERDGNLGIGKAIAYCYEKKQKADPAGAKLRRLLACDSTQEVCSILRPLLRLIASKGVGLSYRRLLEDLLYFGDGQKVKVRWAMDFYGRGTHDRFHAEVESA